VRIYRRGDEGPEILDIQRRLTSLGHAIPTNEQGRFGGATFDAVCAFQRLRNLRVDGLIGADTWGQLVEAGFRPGDRTLYLQAPPMRGDDVRDLQRKLNALGFDVGREDGVLGRETDAAIREFQRNVGEEPDGVMGLHTLDLLERMRPIEGAPGRALVREAEELRQLRGSIDGRIIAIDPGEAPEGDGADPGLRLAQALADGLANEGAKPVILRSAAEAPSVGERARLANEMDAALCVALRPGSLAGDSTCAYFGSPTTHSPAGLHLASTILAALRDALGWEGALAPMTVAILRETRMPAVVLECPADEPDRVAAAVAEGVARYFGAALPDDLSGGPGLAG
jgi:N-acetylmuramoyl-L-alanine amidase